MVHDLLYKKKPLKSVSVEHKIGGSTSKYLNWVYKETSSCHFNVNVCVFERKKKETFNMIVKFCSTFLIVMFLFISGQIPVFKWFVEMEIEYNSKQNDFFFKMIQWKSFFMFGHLSHVIFHWKSDVEGRFVAFTA